MGKPTLLVAIMLLIAVFVLAVNKYLKNKYRSRPNISRIFILSVLIGLIILYMGITGIRITPLQASRAHGFIEKKAELLKEIKLGESYLHVYYNPEEKLYRTSQTKRIGLFYKSNSSTWYYPHEEDKIRTLGGSNVQVKGAYESALYIANKDPRVKEIAIIDSEGNYVSRQPVKAEEPVVIQYKYPAGTNISNYTVAALNEEMDVLYYYGYEKDDNHLSDEEYKWHVMKNEKLDSKFAAKIKSGNLVTNYNLDTAPKDIDALGLNTLNIPVVINISDLSASDMSIDNYSKEQAISLIKRLQGKNINVILEPYPWIANGSEIETEWLPKDLEAFFNNWKTKVLKPLIEDIAVPYHVEALNIGSSFEKMEGEEEKFSDMVGFVRNYYKGLVTYRTSWWRTVQWKDPASKKVKEELELAYNKKLNNKLFSKLDFISVAAYFELTENAVNSVDNLVSAINSTQRYDRKQNVKQEINNFNTKWNKPVFFGELGFPPKDKASVEPWNPSPSDKVNTQEQANCFEAYRTVFEKEPWHLGFSVFAIGSKESDNNYYPSDYSIEVIKKWYSK
jgi:hypothetical protein